MPLFLFSCSPLCCDCFKSCSLPFLLQTFSEPAPAVIAGGSIRMLMRASSVAAQGSASLWPHPGPPAGEPPVLASRAIHARRMESVTRSAICIEFILRCCREPDLCQIKDRAAAATMHGTPTVAAGADPMRAARSSTRPPRCAPGRKTAASRSTPARAVECTAAVERDGPWMTGHDRFPTWRVPESG